MENEHVFLKVNVHWKIPAMLLMDKLNGKESCFFELLAFAWNFLFSNRDDGFQSFRIETNLEDGRLIAKHKEKPCISTEKERRAS